MTTSTPDFTDHQKSALVQLIITGSVSLQQACSQYGLSRDQLKEWVRLFRRTVRQALDHQLRDTLSVQGLDLEPCSEFSGELTAIGVADLLQTIHMGRKDAHITVNHAGEASEIWCRAGRVVDAQSGTLAGEAAFYRILAIERGSVIADFAPNGRARRIQLSTPRLLLKAASSSGLRARLMQRIGDPGQVFSVANDVTAREASPLDPDELDVLSLFDGLRSVEEVLLLSGLPDARALEIVARFRERNLIEPGSTTHDPALDSPTPSSSVTMSYRPFVATVAPEPVRLPTWMLVSGALFCSSLGAATVILATSGGKSSGAAPPAPGASGLDAPASSAPASATRGALAPALPQISAAIPATPRCPERTVWIAGGTFSMGSDSKRPALSLARPSHPVTVRGFCLDVHEVRAADYDACADAGDCTPAHATTHFAEAAGLGDSPAAASRQGELCNSERPGREQHPINCVSHDQAAAYCAMRGGRLPTEAEWEFAARGSASRAFPWGDERLTRWRANACGKECERWHDELGVKGDVQELMYAADDGYAGTAPVGSFPRGRSPEGVDDLIGNVFEWTAEGLYAYERSPVSDPRGPSDSDAYVIRGGNFNSALREFLDPALRFEMHRDSYSHGVGFRCAAEPLGADADERPSSAPR